MLEFNCEQQQQEQPRLQQKLDHGSTSGLEELVMSCTSAGTKGVSEIINAASHIEIEFSSLQNGRKT